MVGRAAVVPLPESLQVRLGPSLRIFRQAATEYLATGAAALVGRRDPSPPDEVEAALRDLEKRIAAWAERPAKGKPPGPA